nr:hypothetical protein [Tanacetum cinerariifolium]
MAALLYKDDHNKVAYLEKGKGWEAYEQILDFLIRSHIRYALTHHPPIVFDSLVKQFWATATVHTLEAGPLEIIATTDGNEVVVTESLIRTQLQLNDETGLYDFTLHDVLDGMREIGYPTDGSLTFYKAKLSSQWRFLIHTLIHCMSPKSGGWNQFLSSIASALICMSTGRTYNFSMFILDGMIGNIGSKRQKFLMYPRFLQMILGIQTTDPSLRPTFDFTAKLFSNMKLNWDGPHMPLLAPMLVVPTGGDGADAVAAGAAAANEVLPPPSPHVPTPVREPTPSPVREPTTFREPTPEDINEGGGGYVSSPKSNEAPPTTAAIAAGGAEDSIIITNLSIKLDKCINKVTTLENELGVTKKVLGGAVLKLVSRVKSTSLGGDTTVEAAYTIYKASQDAHASSDAGHDEDEVPDSTTMPFRHTIPTGDAQTIPAGSTPIPTTGGVSVGSSMDPASQAAAAAAAPSSTAIPAVDKGKAPMVDDSIPADLLTEQERSLQGNKRSWHRRLKLKVLLYLLHKLLGDDVDEDNMSERLGMLFMRKRRELAEQSRVKPMNKTQQWDFMRDFVKIRVLQFIIKRNLERSNLLNFKRSTFRPKPTLEAPTAKRAGQGVPQVPAASSQVPVSVPAALSIAADVSVFAVSTTTADVSPASTLLAESVAEVHANESRSDENQTASKQVSAEDTIDLSTTVVFTSEVSHATPSSLRRRRKQISKKRVTRIVDVADDALIKFNSASKSDGDPSAYAPYIGWEILPTPIGSIHAYYDMEEHNKHFTSIRKLLHMVEKNDLRRLLGNVDKFYQRHEPETFETVDGRVIYMFVDVSYPLSEATLERLLRHMLEVPKLLVGGDLTMAEQLVRFIKAALLNAQSAV